MDRLRTPFFIAALIVQLVVVLTEVGSMAYLDAAAPGAGSSRDLPTPGLGIPYLAFVDGLILWTVGLMGLALIIPARIHGRIQGIGTFIVSLLVLIGSIAAIFIAIGLLMLMVSLLLAVPFGTIAYFAVYADFEKGAALGTLGAIMSLKIAFVVLMILAHQRFLENKGLILIILTSLLANLITSFLQGLPPSFLVSITDDIAAIVVGILAAIWALVLLIGSIPAIIKALRVDRALS